MMKQLEIYTPLLLKIALCILAIPAIFAFFFIGYQVIVGLTRGRAPWFLYPPFILMMVACIPYLYAIKPAIQLVTSVEKKQLFEEKSLVHLTHIMFAFGIIGCLILVEMPFWFLVAQWDDAPGLILMMGFIMGLAFTIALFMILFKKVVAEGIEHQRKK